MEPDFMDGMKPEYSKMIKLLNTLTRKVVSYGEKDELDDYDLCYLQITAAAAVDVLKMIDRGYWRE